MPQEKKSPQLLELIANSVEAIQENILADGPPVGSDGSAGDSWTSVNDALPPQSGPVEIWNSAQDTVEPAYYDAGTNTWRSRYDGIPYFFGMVTHWRGR